MVNNLIRSYNDHYAEARHTLRQAGIEAYALEARILLSRAAGKSESEFLRDIRLYPASDFAPRADAYIARRVAGEPVAYIVGQWSFYGMELEVTPNVLIPRSDTELLVDAALRFLKKRPGCRVLDLCTGSGCIGLALASNAPVSRVVMADKDNAALQLAQKNASNLGLRFRTICIEADALEPPSPALGSFDLICSNPPYIPSAELNTLDASVRDHEPKLALDGGADGLDFYRSILTRWGSCLNPGGQFIFECGEAQSLPIRRLAEEQGFSFVETIIDSLGTERVLVFSAPA